MITTDICLNTPIISNGKKHDVTIAKELKLPPESIVTMDRAYNDYRLFAAWTENEVYFVTRLKKTAEYCVEKDFPVHLNRNIISDRLILFSGPKAQKHCPHIMRKVAVWDTENEQQIILLTNHLKFGGTTISAIHRDRWQVELFFKALKQNLKVKTFVGTSENALYIQFSFGQH